jgi:hypothetical protein
VKDHPSVRVEIGVAMNAVSVSFRQHTHPEWGFNDFWPILSKNYLRGVYSFFAAALPADGALSVPVEGILPFDFGGKNILFILKKLAYKLGIHGFKCRHEGTLAMEFDSVHTSGN